jgi:hypothetical protein
VKQLTGGGVELVYGGVRRCSIEACHVKDETVDLWLPAQQTSAPTQPPGGVSDWIVAALGRSRQEIERIVNHLLSIGDAFKAARCLEIHAQGKLGLEYSGDQILRYDTKDFGIFHQTIFDLLWAASLYQLAKRTRTAQATGVRALLFVEEGIRNITSLNQNDNGELACMAMAFEMAGHCCVAVKAFEGLDYYRASERYWSQAARMRPEAMLQWAHHPVTRTVVGCLKPATALSPRVLTRAEHLFATDYHTRIETAKQWLS